ncbi:MAG: carbon monoxide dehydrogenase [Anaerolineales bacterium]|nr:carbon monoxide dehydrogenase [Anaerolineales bacterium]
MKIEGEHIFNGSSEDVWELVRDPAILATALPGTQELNKISDSEYEGSINVRVGPIAGSFSGRVLVSDEKPPESCTLNAEAEGKAGFFKGSGHVRLHDQGDGTTVMQYEGEVQVGGKLASLGQRLMDTTSKSMIRQGFEVLDKALQARVAAKAQGAEVEYKPPSEAEFAAAVAKDMAKDTLSSPRVIGVVLAVVVVIAILALIWVRVAGGV